MKVSAISVLESCELDVLSEIINFLNDKGIISDEDSPSFHSTVMKQWNDNSNKYLKEKGYNGSKLSVHGSFYDNHGAVYVLFDENKHNYKTAKAYMDNHVKTYNL